MLHDLKNHEMQFSRNVIFHESIFPFHKSTYSDDTILLISNAETLILTCPIIHYKNEIPQNSLVVPILVLVPIISISSRPHSQPSYFHDYILQMSQGVKTMF